MTEIIILRILHITFGVFWAGAIFFSVSVLVPAIAAAGPAGQQVMQRLAPRMTMAMAIGAVVTVLSGLRLYMILSRATPGWISSRHGITLGVGALTAILAFILGAAFTGPTAKRIGKIGAELAAAGGPPPAARVAELEMLRGRLALGARLVALLVAVTVIAMAVARYLV